MPTKNVMATEEEMMEFEDDATLIDRTIWLEMQRDKIVCDKNEGGPTGKPFIGAPIIFMYSRTWEAVMSRLALTKDELIRRAKDESTKSDS